MTSSTTPPDSSPTSLQETLSAVLPAGFNCTVRYVQSPAKPCDPLFSAPPGQPAERTRLASHFLTLSVDPASLGHETTTGGNHVISFAIEVLLFTTRRLTTLFVSKVDSTSYIPRQRPSPIQTTVTTFLRWLADNERTQRPTRKIVISLFARAQAQYLFPGSSDNKSKHVLDDRQLIKWWARVLDPIIPSSPSPSTSPSYQGYIAVPGYATSELKRSFMPASSTKDPPNWLPGHPLTSLAATRHIPPDAPPRCLLPRFPDDPKARFIQDLDDEVGISQDSQSTSSSSNLSSPSKKGASNKSGGKWKSILDIERFWEAMEFRQECSSGRVVGFLWLVISPSATATKKDVIETQSQNSEAVPSSPIPVPSSPLPSTLPSQPNHRSTRRRNPLSGPIIPRQPRPKPTSSSSLSTMLTSTSSSISGGSILLSEEVYDKAMQTLLASDFSTLSAAVRSTSRWIGEIRSGIEGSADVGMKVVGTKEVAAQTVGKETVDGVNDLGGLRRKRKGNEGESGDAEKDEGGGKVEQVPQQGEQGEKVNVLAAGMVRKKAKKG
ncbi:DNA damage response protein Rtt109 [Zymoseptoria brevis]|uniref:histone acetyltransferase n=1 Tax=Zymoseptoria brevis TaxID=1047168 RepID=A0A0F4G7T9_9PEZI|nr:DNA damage response protein Rtt109 [Zymoseptoria brevis]